MPSLESESSTLKKTVSVMPTLTREEADDNDHETSDQVATEARRSTRTRSAPEWYSNNVLEAMLLDNGEPSKYEETMMSPDSDKWLESMKPEIGSMYKNEVWTLVDLPNDRQAIDNKWIFKRKTNTDGNITSTKFDLLRKVSDKFKELTTMRLSHP